jgi:hypothetical protein
MTGDPWTLIISGAVVALLTYALPKVIEGVFRKQITHNEAEQAAENIESMRWIKTKAYVMELEAEIKRLRAILIRHRIDPNESGPLDTQPNKSELKQ